MARKQKYIYLREHEIEDFLDKWNHIDTMTENENWFTVIYTPVSEQKPVNMELTQELDKIVERWNNAEIDNPNRLPNRKQLPQIRKITPTMRRSYQTKRDTYKYEEVIQGIINYIKDITERKQKEHTDTYYNHRFTLQTFLKQSNWLDRFINL